MIQPPKFIIPVISACNFLIGVGVFVIIGILDTFGRRSGHRARASGHFDDNLCAVICRAVPRSCQLYWQYWAQTRYDLWADVILIASLLSALATSLTTLGFARVLAAVGAGMFTPVGSRRCRGAVPCRATRPRFGRRDVWISSCPSPWCARRQLDRLYLRLALSILGRCRDQYPRNISALDVRACRPNLSSSHIQRLA